MGILASPLIKTVLLLAGGLAYLAILAFCTRWFARRPADAMSLMMAVAPLEVISIYKGITLKPFLLLFPAVVAGIAWHYRDRLLRPPEWTSWDWCILSCMGAMGLSCLFAYSPMQAVRMTVQLGIVFAVCMGTTRLISDREQLERYLKFFTWSAVAVCGYAFWQAAGYFLGIPSQPLLALARLNPTLPRMLVEPGAIVFSQGMSVVRVSGTFFDWNIFSAYLVIVLSLFLVYAWRGLLQGNLPGRVSWGLIVLMATWLLTFSRSGWLGGVTAAAVLVGFGFPIRRLARKYLVFVGIVAVICIIAQINPIGMVARRVNQSLTGERSVMEHAYYGLAALEMLRNHPLTGVGIHNFSTVYQARFNPNLPGATAHSGFLSIFAEMGLIGGVIFVFTYLVVLHRLWAVQRGLAIHDPDGLLLRGILAATVGLGVCNLFYHFWTQLFLWCFFAFAVAAANVVEGSTRRTLPGEADK
ncbi:MAG TPA: O-antigen ligase family protein [bacterium]|nr:O-antigen ligase family protein [bacterium]HQO34411.1 O-antigen ligase family protein [bacterium]HQP98711.1 O-antigen ligase family protein [bacterium]